MDIRNAVQTLQKLKHCAVEAGIYDHWFLCFGGMLGAVRPTMRKWGGDIVYVTGVMEHDNDLDIGIFADKITAEQENTYVRLIKESGLTKIRGEDPGHKMYRTDTNRLVWMTLRGSKPPIGTKCCHWFWLPWNGHYWHTKGSKWLGGKFDNRQFEYNQNDDAMMLGVPGDTLSDLTEVDYDGMKLNVPLNAGSCCDLWYPGWLTPKESGTSAKAIVARVKKWEDQSTWKMLPGMKI